MKFTRETLEELLEAVVESYFSDETVRYGYGLMDVIEDVKMQYRDEINTLEVIE